MTTLITVNRAFHGQRITGQQRYATEIARRLGTHHGVRSVSPPDQVAARGALAWLWTLLALPARARRGVLISLTSRAPVGHRRHVVVIHDLFVLTNPEWYSTVYVRTHAPLLRRNLAEARVVVAVSEPVARQIRASGLTGAPVVVAPNAPSDVFARAQSLDAGPVLSGLGLTTDRYLLSVGSRDPRKNTRRLVAAHAGLPAAIRQRFPLVLVGGSHASFRDDELALHDEVIPAGYVSDEELAVLYRSARGVTFPSLAEGFGLPIIEAAIAGARLTVSDIEVFRWIGRTEMDYVDPLDVTDIRRGLSRLVETPGTVPVPDRGALAARFDWDRSAAIILRACQTAASAVA